MQRINSNSREKCTLDVRGQRGFTLIELMIVIAIIGILAAIAIPSYQNYTTRSQVTEGVTLVSGLQTSVAEYFAQNGSFPGLASLTSVASTSITGKYVTSVSVTGGTITVAYSTAAKKVSGDTLAITPYANANGDIVWTCGTATLPSGFTVSVSGTAGTTNVPVQYLPSSCHS